MFNLVAAFVVLVMGGCTTQVYIQVPPPLEQQIVINKGQSPEPQQEQPAVKEEPVKKKKKPRWSTFCRDRKKNMVEWENVWCRV